MMKRMEPTRQERAEKIAQFGELERVSLNLYNVHSQTCNRVYSVFKFNGAWTCDCPDYTHRHALCKHILAVRELLLEATVE